MVAPFVADVMKQDTLVSDATGGIVMFTDGERVVREAAPLGLNFTADNLADLIRLYANDQRLGARISTVSAAVLGVAFVVLIVTSSAIYAVRNARRLLPLYIQGASWRKLLWLAVTLDVVVILIACGAATARKTLKPAALS